MTGLGLQEMGLTWLEGILTSGEVTEKLEEAGRLYYSNSFVTFNLLPLVIAAVVLYYIFGNWESGDSYGGSSSGYDAPEAGYGAPEASYAAPDAGYGAPAPNAGYGFRLNKRNTILDLQAKIASLQDKQYGATENEAYGAYSPYDTSSLSYDS